MKKQFLLLIYVFFCSFFAFSVEDDKLVIFGESYKNITEIDYEEFPILKKNYYDIWDLGCETFSKTDDYSDIFCCRVFTQTCGAFNFYRFIFAADFFDGQYLSQIINQECVTFDLGQLVFLEYKNKLILINAKHIVGTKLGDDTKQYFMQKVFSNTEISLHNKVGVIFINHQTFEGYTYDRYSDENPQNQYKEIGNSVAEIYKMSDLVVKLRNVNPNEDIIKINLNKLDVVKAETSKAFVDKSCPFRYTLQNLFDSRNDTCFAGNMQNSEIFLKFQIKSTIFNNKISIVNGNCKNIRKYQKNNRILTFYLDDKKCNLLDDFRAGVQSFDFDNTDDCVTFKTNDLVLVDEGLTCLSEFDIF